MRRPSPTGVECADERSECDPREDPKSIIVDRICAREVVIVPHAVELPVDGVLDSEAGVEPRTERRVTGAPRREVNLSHHTVAVRAAVVIQVEILRSGDAERRYGETDLVVPRVANCRAPFIEVIAPAVEVACVADQFQRTARAKIAALMLEADVSA